MARVEWMSLRLSWIQENFPTPSSLCPPGWGTGPGRMWTSTGRSTSSAKLMTTVSFFFAPLHFFLLVGCLLRSFLPTTNQHQWLPASLSQVLGLNLFHLSIIRAPHAPWKHRLSRHFPGHGESIARKDVIANYFPFLFLKSILNDLTRESSLKVPWVPAGISPWGSITILGFWGDPKNQ